ncbi:hypothetical protein ADK41_08360 [Streptomyces caelestis]|uniref:Uncharacterized protein n=1 Tax=Streptomyces caelestis TaxID=36816 RepID=A0A0M9X9R3_9ACTN|nr:hypothetical protein ADK41_08360 [Streptomyces caelestis]
MSTGERGRRGAARSGRGRSRTRPREPVPVGRRTAPPVRAGGRAGRRRAPRGVRGARRSGRWFRRPRCAGPRRRCVPSRRVPSGR